MGSDPIFFVPPPSYLVPILAGGATLGLLAWMLARDVRLPLDHPNERSLHKRPVPRSGGMAIMAGVFCALAVLMISPVLVLPTVILAAISFLDDLRGVPVALRLAVHCIVAAGFTAAAFPAAPQGLPVLVFISAVWMTNLYNFMDGSDGLAGGMALIGFGFLGTGAWLAGGTALALACFAIAASAAAFLVFNFHPARVFMGDTGSIPLGFLAAGVGAIGWRDGLWPMWFAPVVFSPFIADASLTLIRRILRQERVWVAHPDHYYQRLVLMGWGHRKTALAEYGLMVFCGLMALWATRQPVYLQIGAAAILAVSYGALVVAVTFAWRRFTEKKR